MSEYYLCSIDATGDDGSLGRLVNDSRYFPNAIMHRISNQPNDHHLCLFAMENIKSGDEILYWYGEENLTWHKEVRPYFILYFEMLLNLF